MDNFLNWPDLLQFPKADDMSPLRMFTRDNSSFNDLSYSFISSSYKLDLDEQGIRKGYDKKEEYFSELEKEAEITFNQGPTFKYPEVSSIASFYEATTKNESKSGAPSKIDLLDKVPSSIQDDQTSLLSQVSNEYSVVRKEDHTKSAISSEKSFDGDTPSQNKVNNSCKYPTGDEPRKIDEGDLIFLIRKVNKKTNTSVLLTKHRKKITMCPHKTLEYYAKGMCKNCYHNKGKRSKKATKCEHTQRDHYAKGLCKNCYLHFFHIKKKQRKASTVVSDSVSQS